MSSPTIQRINDPDPLNNTPTSANRTKSQRLAHANSNYLASFARGSPSQAKRALEAHILDTDRRIQDATKFGTTLVDQKRQLSEHLHDLEAQENDEEIDVDLKHKLTELEKDYNEVGRETVRSFMPRGSRSSVDMRSGEADRTPLADKGSNTNTDRKMRPESPEKMSKGSLRKLKNQPQNRVHDIEFATEISTSLLGQVRGLQNLLAEKEEALKKAQKDNSKLQTDFEGLTQRMRGLGDDEQKYKDENWNLETQVQDLTAVIKEAALREDKLQQSLNAVKEEKVNSEREQEELRSQHARLIDEHTALKKNHDMHVGELTRDLQDTQRERDEMQKRINELYSQNQDLAQAVAYRAKTEQEGNDREIREDEIVESVELETPESSPPASPTKATPRHGHLETETLKSSLHHAHRMIQSLKNNIHREKTEKVELKRMLQDARDDIEQQKVGENGPAAANAGRKRKPGLGQDAFKKPSLPSKLGGLRSTSEWEDFDGSPSGKVSTTFEPDFSTDASDAFETADEKQTGIQTDTDASFESAADTMAGSSDDGEVTETEDNFNNSLPRSLSRIPMLKRGSFESTASDEEDALDPSTPSLRQPKYKLKLHRGSHRSETSTRDSPASFISNASGQSLPRSSQNLAAELEDMDSASSAATSRATTVEPSPGRSSVAPQTPIAQRSDTGIRSSGASFPPNLTYVDSSTMTEPWEPEQKRVETADVGVGPIVTGTGVDAGTSTLEFSAPIETREAATQVTPKKDKLAMELQMSAIGCQSTTPIAPPEPVANVRPMYATPEARHFEPPTASRSTPASNKDETFSTPSIPGTERVGNLTPSTQQFLNDVLAQAREKRAELAATKVAATSPGLTKGSDSTEKASIGKAQLISSNASGDELRTSANEPKTPEGTCLPEPTLSIYTPETKDDSVFREPTLTFSDPDSAGPATPIKYDLQISPSFTRNMAVPRMASSNTVNSSTQTVMSDERIESLLKGARQRSSTHSPSTIPSNRGSPGSNRTMSMGTSSDSNLLKGLGKRPSSSSGITRTTGSSSPIAGKEIPPLPADHKEVIAEAKTRTPSLISMPPPSFPASKLSSPSQPHDRTSSGTFSQTPLRAVNSARNRLPSIAGNTTLSQRSSISSFASEIEERFNIDRNSALYGDIPGANNADPRMIQAITQTMIGEFLWKYTRKAGRGDSHSENRHRRFFWIHPYTRTLYWSNRDPSVAGRSELKAKSVAIEAVRVVGDNNPIPPGICNKSIVIVTPGRSIKVTAPTQKRHETWFNALSYLLLRNAPEQDDDNVAHTGYSNTAYTGLTAEDVAEFNPTLHPRTNSRFSHRSTSSAVTSGRRSSAAPTSNRTSSPQGRSPVSNSLAVRQSYATRRRASSRVSNNTFSPLSANPIESQRTSALPEATLADGSSTMSLPNGESVSNTQVHDGKIDNVAQTGNHQLEVDGDGFKKPATRPSGPNTRPNSKSELGEEHKGRLSSITSRLSRASFASIGRGRRATRSEVEAASPVQIQPAAEGDGHQDQYVFKRTADGTLENVRACCNGKHDLSTLQHRSESRASLGRGRSQSAGGKRASLSQRVAPRPVGGA